MFAEDNVVCKRHVVVTGNVVADDEIVIVADIVFVVVEDVSSKCYCCNSRQYCCKILAGGC